jgi:tRNA pseudouridine55 synthase
VLPVGAGNATRLFDYFLEKEKEYIAEFTFGVSSDTLDSTGELLYGGRIPSEDEIAKVLPTMCGEVMQLPPKYSAKNVGGKRGYELARAGVDFELQPKKIVIHDMSVLGQVNETTFRIKIRCGGGTYIRSIGRDLAAALDTHAVMSALRRTQSGIFVESNAIPFSVFEADPTPAELEKYILPTDSVLPYEALTVSFRNHTKLLNGMKVAVDAQDGLYKFYNEDGSFYGLAEVQGGLAKLKTKLCL